MHTLALRDARLHAEIVPELGAALSRLDWVAHGQTLPVLRAFEADGQLPRPNQLACFPLLPWSNRLNGGFSFEGRHYPIAPNRAGDPFPMHGQGWLLPWRVCEHTPLRAVLALDCGSGAPFCYHAQITYALGEHGLTVTLDVRNTGQVALPFGLGLHPWMPRSAGVTLQARARSVWLAGADALPAHAVPVPDAWSFVQPRALPPTVIDNVFEGWDGLARIVWPEYAMALTISSDCGYFIVYAPPGKDFFCFEPVDHRIDAHNGAGGPVRHGLTILAPGQSLRRHCRFDPRVN